MIAVKGLVKDFGSFQALKGLNSGVGFVRA